MKRLLGQKMTKKRHPNGAHGSQGFLPVILSQLPASIFSPETQNMDQLRAFSAIYSLSCYLVLEIPGPLGTWDSSSPFIYYCSDSTLTFIDMKIPREELKKWALTLLL